MKFSKYPKAAGAGVFVAFCLVMGCKDPISPPPPDEATRNFLMGAGATARNGDYSGQGFADMIEIFRSRSAGELAGIYTNWRDSRNTSGQVPQIVGVYDELGRRNNFTPVFNLNFFDVATGSPDLGTPSNNTNNWTNSAARSLFKEAATRIAQLRPAYLALGNEINLYNVSHPEDFANFAAIYQETYDAVKAVSPETKVFTVFQLEGLKGLIALSYGQSVASWNLLDQFRGKLDLVGFTSYPSLVYSTQPTEVPASYYNEIATEVSRRLGDVKIAFTEIGWDAQFFNSTEQEQADFVPRFFELTESLEKTLVIWGLLHDVNLGSPLDHAGLRRFSGEIKPAWNEWLKLAQKSVAK